MSIKDLAIQAYDAKAAADAAAYEAKLAKDRAATLSAARQWFVENIATPETVEITDRGNTVKVTLDGMTFHWGRETQWNSHADLKRYCCVLVDERLPPNFTGQTGPHYSRPIHDLAGLGKILKALGR